MTEKPPSTCFAPAKINLALQVTGLRQDGYHLLESLVAFADIGDKIEILEPADTFTLKVDGPFAGEIDDHDDNLVLKAARLFQQIANKPASFCAAIQLTKNLPVASGIGGGSADAAATLLALASHYDIKDEKLLHHVAQQLGADVPMCLTSQTLIASGIGEILKPLTAFPTLHLVLVNPLVAVSTPQIFRQLASKTNPPLEALPDKPDYPALLAWLARQRNDLQAPALTVQPLIKAALDALAEHSAQLERMSGSGATCFGIYPDSQSANEAEAALAKRFPDWWIKQTQTRDFGMDRVSLAQPEQSNHVPH